ncbi:hypothetical protein BU24DRAFT_460167 [Aaosphaeria arxii CBS 175.79]|uniref:Uncharacterized protein n=1 Tax=Aaosphaeria arxii CBS 175.79 TaxID=1450172 RepID=A0A6A5XV27_9PLEO|nr:uncharacterized protein BU24DRAFT_460167 [Aaosphaeria arxii CBS 175.79]KAF2017072.1 hypothetical protein BU24DRAFT_460167 [Aaosphaeria arxii CBS 175.79]
MTRIKQENPKEPRRGSKRAADHSAAKPKRKSTRLSDASTAQDLLTRDVKRLRQRLREGQFLSNSKDLLEGKLGKLKEELQAAKEPPNPFNGVFIPYKQKARQEVQNAKAKLDFVKKLLNTAIKERKKTKAKNNQSASIIQDLQAELKQEKEKSKAVNAAFAKFEAAFTSIQG